MKNRSRLIRKITNLLGITFIALGMIPVPVLSQIGSAYAQVEDGAAAITLPTFTSYSELLESTSTEEPPVVETPDEAPAEQGDEPPAVEPPAEEPPVEEPPVEEPPAEEAVEEAPVEEPPAEETVEEPPAEEAVEEPATEVVEESLAEVVEILHEEEVVLVDAGGEEIPLASVEAAEMLSLPDPMYCPPGEIYGGPTCSPAQLTMAAAIADAAGNGGTIFVEGGDFTGFTLTGFDGYDLVIEGGLGGTTIFNSQIYLTGNSANIFLRNFTAHGADADAGVNILGGTGVTTDDTPNHPCA